MTNYSLFFIKDMPANQSFNTRSTGNKMGLGKFYKSNGLTLTLQYMATRRLKKLYNWLLAKKIRGGGKIDVEPFSHIRGLSRMRIGRNFSAGPGLRLEVITAKGD